MEEITSAPTTKIEIVQLAIAIAGKQQTVNTIDGGGALAINASMVYDSLVCAELGSNRWRFAQDFQQIAILTALDPTFDGWKYFCELPAECLMVQYVTPNCDYLVFGNKILTRSNQKLTVVFGRNVPVSKWPGAFSIYVAFRLATMLGITTTNSDRMLARIDKETSNWESRALFADGQSSSTQPMRYNPYVDIRYKQRTRGFGQ